MIRIHKTQCFAERMAGLDDIRAKAKIAAKIDQLALGKPDATESTVNGISKLWIHYGLGYQVHFIRRRVKVIRLLCVCDSRTHIMYASTFPAKSEPASCR